MVTVRSLCIMIHKIKKAVYKDCVVMLEEGICGRTVRTIFECTEHHIYVPCRSACDWDQELLKSIDQEHTAAI